MTFADKSGTLRLMKSLFLKGFGIPSVLAGRLQPGSGFVQICLLFVLGLAPAVQGGTNAANSAIVETNRVYVIDVRTEAEWNNGHIKNAILVPYDQIKERIAEVTTDKTASIVLYCRSGRRSGIAQRSLKEMGYRNVQNLGSLQDAEKKLGVSP